jgi:hypothetical protein
MKNGYREKGLFRVCGEVFRQRLQLFKENLVPASTPA